MTSEVKNRIKELLKESSSYNSNDLLVNALAENKKLLQFSGSLSIDLEVFPKQIIKEAKATLKESGVNSLCLSSGIIHIPNNTQLTCTPILLTPLQFKIDKIKGAIVLEVIEEDCFVNPYLISEFNQGVDKNAIEALLHSTDLNDWANYFDSRELTVDRESQFIGNFHHHRYQVIKELEELLAAEVISPNINALLGDSSSEPSEIYDFSGGTLFQSDVDHESVFDQVQIENTVIQGPPGTGKSQVLGNLIGKALYANKSTLVLSEKRAALEVLTKRLSQFNLEKLCYVSTSNDLSKSLLKELKSSWDFFESVQLKPVINPRVSEQLEDNLQMTLDLLNQKELIGGVSFQEFKDLSSETKILKEQYSSTLPSIKTYVELKNVLTTCYDLGLEQALSFIKKEALIGDDFHSLDQLIEEWSVQLKELNNAFEIKTWEDVNKSMTLAATCQIYENDLFKKYAKIFKPNSRPQNKFLKLRKDFKVTLAEIEKEVKNQKHWISEPSLIEANDLLKIVQNTGFLKGQKAKRKWKTYSNLSLDYATEALEDRIKILALEERLSQIKIDFCEIGLDSGDVNIDLIANSIGQYTKANWEIYENIELEKKRLMTSLHGKIHKLWISLSKNLTLSNESDLFSIIDSIKKSLPDIITHKQLISKLDQNCLTLLGKSSTISSFEQHLFSGHWIQFQERFPTFSNFEIKEIKDKVEEITIAQTNEAILTSKQIEFNVQLRFKEYHSILNTPAHKLSAENKALKKQLRKGKSILIKEFAKTRSHPSLRELFNSEAIHWIQLLKPIWLSNPTQLSNCFPQQTELFDLCIFDEASQIPLQNALGAIQRAKRIVVAGDEHQMGPTSYFKSGSNEIVDLLHQANYNWKNVALKHHYRSAHPDLISFSNQHFYANSLKAYPSYNTETPLHLHKISDGVFIQRKNENEAKHVVKLISDKLNSNSTIGVVAFSEEQLNCIWNNLNQKDQIKLNERLENNLGFFKSLENVQGDECDHLIISFGYAYNEAKEFAMRFGPMNTTNGRRRLNVLLTRARKTINFVCSVNSSDFKLTDNESVLLIKKWFQFIEGYEYDANIQLPIDIASSVVKNVITFKQIQTQLPSTRELVTLHSVLSSRGWKINYS